MQYKAVIFDLDGTLVNSLNDLAASVNIVLASYNLPTHDVESYKYRVGNGIRKLMQRSLPEDKQDLLDEALEKFKAVYARHNMDKTRPYEGITELLEKLRAQNIKLGVCTNKHDEAAKVIIKALFGEDIFDEIIGDKQGLKRKPDPGKVLTMAQNWNLQPQEIAYLGDSGVDMQTAVNAGMLAVGVLWGFRTEAELKENGADILISSPLELLQAVNFAK
ncbi:MAG TPA: HAD family hydrolase [Megamonas hypermegale]|uniref:HAD family hydrolase n=1 Tax=Megamonas hypermegale TaxID=158847 RepID=A0A921HNP1_9FIRM|nr:HAD family hydrolase [Megamonas hypermegale]